MFANSGVQRDLPRGCETIMEVKKGKAGRPNFKFKGGDDTFLFPSTSHHCLQINKTYPFHSKYW